MSEGQVVIHFQQPFGSEKATKSAEAKAKNEMSLTIILSRTTYSLTFLFAAWKNAVLWMDPTDDEHVSTIVLIS